MLHGARSRTGATAPAPGIGAMCLALFALDAHPAFALVVAANRDEYHARPAAPAAWWEEGWLGGRDLAAGGTWLGVTRAARWAFVTNVRGIRDETIPQHRRAAHSCRPCSPIPHPHPRASPGSSTSAADHNGFNLVTGLGAEAHWGSNRASPPRALAAGDLRPVECRARHAVAETDAHEGGICRVVRARRRRLRGRLCACSATGPARPMSCCRRRAFRANANSCSRRRSSSMTAMARAVRRCSPSIAGARRTSSSARSTRRVIRSAMSSIALRIATAATG